MRRLWVVIPIVAVVLVVTWGLITEKICAAYSLTLSTSEGEMEDLANNNEITYGKVQASAKVSGYFRKQLSCELVLDPIHFYSPWGRHS